MFPRLSVLLISSLLSACSLLATYRDPERDISVETDVVAGTTVE